MCTIAGYVGEKEAAPILINMMKMLEGLDSGYFTGIATISEGKLYCRKVIGDLQHLLETTDAASLPGKIGFIHSRTLGNGEGSVEWGHPFVAKKDGVPYLSHVSNGGAGYFANRFDDIAAVANALLKEGYEIPSKEHFEKPKIKVSDGDAVHVSDVTTQYIMKLMNDGASLLEAEEKALMNIPSDDVDLNICLDEPTCIAYAKMSQPMTLGFCPHGAYLATAALALPDDIRDVILLPSFTAGKVYCDHYVQKPFDTLPCTYEKMDNELLLRAYPLILDMLKTEKESVGAIRSKLRPLLFPADAQSAPTTFVIYETLRAMKKQGILHSEIVTVPGRDGLTAPKTLFWVE